MAICRLLSQDSLMAGVKVLNTAVKNVGRPDLPGERKGSGFANREIRDQLCPPHPPAGRSGRGGAATSPQPHPKAAPPGTTHLSCFPGSCSWIRQQSAARISSSFFRMSLCSPDVQSCATDWFKFCEGNRCPP